MLNSIILTMHEFVLQVKE
ncbi:hypothetical protein L195_g064367, partial [Trifolium pratense]